MKRALALLTLFMALIPASAAAPDLRLMKFYEDGNRQYFDNKLPHNTIVSFDTPEHENSAATTAEHDGHFVIRIDPKINNIWQMAEMTEYHEMCHVETFTELDEHGPKWQACMHRLANAGAFDNLW
jgi:SprT-like family protein